MNDGPLAAMLAELDAELARQPDRRRGAREILDRIEARAPGAVLASAARIQLRSLGCAAPERSHG